MDTDEYRFLVDPLVESIKEAYMAFYGDPSPMLPSAEDHLDVEKAQWRSAFLEFGISDSGDAARSMVTAKSGVECLRVNSDDRLGTPLESIRDQMASWRGPARTSFESYLNKVEKAFEYQTECADFLSKLIEIQHGLIKAGNEYAYQIGVQTISALEKAKKEEERKDREALGKIIAAISAAFATAVTGGAAAVVASAITAIGAVAGAIVEVSTGDTPQDVIESMYEQFDKAASTMAADRKKLSEAIEACRREYLDGDAKRILPPEVNLVET